MTSHWPKLTALLLALFLLVPSSFADDWIGWPVPSNTTWYVLATNHYIAQLYSGLVERCEAAGVASPTNTDTWIAFSGTNASGVIQYINVVTTNVYAPFEYTYTDPITSTPILSTNYPYVKQAWIAKWDQFFSTCGRVSGVWVDRAQFDANGLLTAWYTNLTNSVVFPALTYTQIFANASVGYGTNFTRRPLLPTNDLVMCSIQSRGSNQWSFARIDTSDSYRYDQTALPWFELSTDFYAWPTQSFTITGQVWNTTTQTASNDSETITIGGITNYHLTKLWHNVTNITGAAGYGLLASNTTWRIAYRDGYATYGNMPYRLYALDLNERRNVLAQLTHTAKTYTIWVNAGDSPPSTNYWYGRTTSPGYVDHPEYAVAAAVSNFTYRNAAISDVRNGDNAGSAVWRDWENGNHTSHVYVVRLWGCTWDQWRVPQWATNQTKEADLYALTKCFASDGSQTATNPPYWSFDGLDHTGLVYNVANYLGRQYVTAATGLLQNSAGVVLTNVWSIATTDTDIITNYLASLNGAENIYYTRGFTFTDTCVVYCHTNWYRFK